MLQRRVGMRIREIRERWGMSQEELAKRLNLSVSAVKTWENGLGYPSIENCVGLTQVFHISSEYFFEKIREYCPTFVCLMVVTYERMMKKYV